jgi:hypothetical protein
VQFSEVLQSCGVLLGFLFFFIVVYMVVCFVYFCLILSVMYSFCYVYVFLLCSLHSVFCCVYSVFMVPTGIFRLP